MNQPNNNKDFYRYLHYKCLKRIVFHSLINFRLDRNFKHFNLLEITRVTYGSTIPLRYHAVKPLGLLNKSGETKEVG